MSPAARGLAVLGSLAGFNATGLMNQRAIESAPVIEELFGIMGSSLRTR